MIILRATVLTLAPEIQVEVVLVALMVLQLHQAHQEFNAVIGILSHGLNIVQSTNAAVLMV